MIGIVADGFGVSHEPILNFLSRAKPAFSVIINEKEKLANPAADYTEVCFRDVNDDDIFNDEGFDARAFAYSLAVGLKPGIGLHGGNEPGESDRLIEKTCDFMEGCIELNRPGYLFNFAVFHPTAYWYWRLTQHERFNQLWDRGVFYICRHDYIGNSFQQAIADGAILREIWRDAEDRYKRIRVTEWGWLERRTDHEGKLYYDPHAGWKNRISEDYYIQQLELYINDLNDRGRNTPFTVFSWHKWHGFEIQDASKFQEAIIRANSLVQGLEMHYLTHPQQSDPAWQRWNIRATREASSQLLKTINIVTTPVILHSLSGGRLEVEADGVRGFVYQSGDSRLGTLGVKRK